MNPFWPDRPEDTSQDPPRPAGPLGFGGAPTDITGDLARRRGQGHPSFRRAPHPARRVVALSIEVGLVTALGAVIISVAGTSLEEGWPMGVAVGVLFGLRPVLLSTTGATLGQWLTGYRIVGSGGERPGFRRVVWREFYGVAIVLLWARRSLRHIARRAPLEESPAGTVRRWPHDYEANTWPVMADGS